MNGFGYLHSKSGENGSGSGSRSMPVGRFGRLIGGTFISGPGCSAGRLTTDRNKLLRPTAFKSWIHFLIA